jgi:glycosyltransferase involved in cell wall biosynthesis
VRIVLDLQGAQSASRSRGIGRYSLALAKAMVRESRGHEFHVILNALLLDTVEALRAEFEGLVPPERIVVFDVPGPVAEIDLANAWRVRAAEVIRENALRDLDPDFVHLSSLFEGVTDNAVTSVGRLDASVPTAVTLYDLIPWLRPHIYLADSKVNTWYLRKLQSLKRAHSLLAISESSRREAIDALAIPEDRVINIGSGVDAWFRPAALTDNERSRLLHRYGLARPFLMYTGGIEPRKNIEGLIEAYALLPHALRERHQLAIVCEARDVDRKRLEDLSRSQGLRESDVVLTGFVSDQNLIALYSVCTLFVFPSLHEGFGLPALEAMACGAPTIGSSSSSIPEVIGRSDALFDATKPQDIAAKIAQVLEDEGLRRDLATHGLKQAQAFTWEASARRALQAFEAARGKCIESTPTRIHISDNGPRARLAYVSPFPPERSGIADYSAELLPELACFYEIDVIADQPTVSAPWINANFPVRDRAWFESNAHRYERILYQMGNSAFHAHMFNWMERWPGVVSLHDFFLSGVYHWLEATSRAPRTFHQAAYRAHGYSALKHLAREGSEPTIFAYPCNRDVLDNAIGVIVHSDFSLRLAQQWYGASLADTWRVIPQLRAVPRLIDRQAARTTLGLGSEDFLVCSFGLLAPTKLNDRLLAAWLQSTLADKHHCHLVFVGANEGADYGEALTARIRASGLAARIRITGFAEPETFSTYLAAANLAVQLRSRSRGEVSRAVLDALAYGLPVLLNAHGPNSDYPADVVFKLEDEFTNDELTAALERLYNDSALRASLGAKGIGFLQKYHHPAACGRAYFEALEEFAVVSAGARQHRLLQALHSISSPPPLEDDLLAASRAIAANRRAITPRQWLVDCSHLALLDLGTGIQRVVRNVLQEFLEEPPEDIRTEPVYADEGQYRFARRFMLRQLGLTDDALEDSPIAARSGDLFFGLDLAPRLVPQHEPFLEQLRAHGIKIVFAVYDLIPVLRPDTFPDDTNATFTNWLRTIARVSDGLICMSRTVTNELKNWLDAEQPHRRRELRLGYVQPGADTEAKLPKAGLPDDAGAILAELRARPSLVMVGTIEPRRGHVQSLAAFDTLWQLGLEANLVIVGKQGWMVEVFVERVRKHPELGRRLFWLENVSNEYLELIYPACAALLAASEAEGFGLPLIEAARHGLPIIARDIPVFREVAGEHAFYFSGHAPESLAIGLQQWFDLYATGMAPPSHGLRWLTWRQSVETLKEMLLDDRHPQWIHSWQPGHRWHPQPSGPRLYSKVGQHSEEGVSS